MGREVFATGKDCVVGAHLATAGIIGLGCGRRRFVDGSCVAVCAQAWDQDKKQHGDSEGQQDEQYAPHSNTPCLDLRPGGE